MSVTMSKTFLTTRRGDDGTTCIGGGRVPKSHPSVELVGILDSMQSYVGLLHAHPELSDDADIICKDFYTIMGMVHVKIPELPTKSDIQPFMDNLEKIISGLELPKMNQFIQPNVRTATANMARATCRLYERQILKIETDLESERALSAYFNRLSSVLYGFMLLLHFSKTPPIKYDRYFATAIMILFAIGVLELIFQ